MQYANVVFATFLFFLLFACNASQSSKATQQNNLEKSSKTQNHTLQGELLSTIPVDGKLQDAHLQMYVSVKIKQEQLRYQQEISQSKELEQDNRYSHNYTDRDLETIAINEFGFDPKIYHWSKKIIQNTLRVNVSEESRSDTGSKQLGNQVLKHNLSVLAKHNDELRFANSYRLKLNISSNQQTAFKNVNKTQSAVTPKPST